MVHRANPADDPVPSHRAVLEAIAARDPLAAEAAMFGLLDNSTTDLSRAVLGRRGTERGKQVGGSR